MIRKMVDDGATCSSVAKTIMNLGMIDRELGPATIRKIAIRARKRIAQGNGVGSGTSPAP